MFISSVEAFFFLVPHPVYANGSSIDCWPAGAAGVDFIQHPAENELG